MTNIVVIGYGNDLRCDDGIGQQVANKLHISNVKCLAVHQLTPELIETLNTADLAIFVDACLNPKKNSKNLNIQVRRLEPDHNKLIAGHITNPELLLSLTKAIYGHYPSALLVTVPGVNFELGENLSIVGEKGVVKALTTITQIIDIFEWCHITIHVKYLHNLVLRTFLFFI
ncbi:MAG: hydrogenase maturation protease [Calothrix sp. C42_A2020_038]|nr:hydrogenase maturation protease [Calothrix sp. C42_A2020_038]